MSAAKPPVTAAPVEVESPRLAPEQEETSPRADAPAAEMSKAEMPKEEASTVEPVKTEMPAVEAVKANPPPIPGQLLIMSPADRTWNDNDAAGAAPETASEPASGKRRM